MIPFVGLASGIGGGNPGSAEGPLLLKSRLQIPADWRAMFSSTDLVREPLEIIASLNHQLAQEITTLVKEDSFFISIGGDHSSGIGVWSAAASTLRSQGDLGLIWIDAHMDAHTFQTTESGNIHGMPVAVLLGHGEKSLTQIGDSFPKVKPENLVLMGIRSFEKGEAELLNALNVRIYYMDEVTDRGFQTVFKEALEIVSRNTAGFGVSFDLDSIDPKDAPAVGTPVPGGIDAEEFLHALRLFEEFPPLGFELVEFNPSLDQDNRSLGLIQKILENILQSCEQRSVSTL